MGGLILLRPWWLAALLPVAALALWSWRRAPDAGGWQRVMPPPMLAAMQALGHLGGRTSAWQGWLAPGALVALVLGLAGPALPRADTPVLAQTDAAVIAMDLSPSVAQGPALAEAQLAAAGLVQGLAGRPVGLILYAGEAFTVAAPTADGATLETQIAVLDTETLPATGSRPAAALGLAGEMLADVRRADLIVISDGGGVDSAALAEADRLAGRGIRISALQLAGRAEGAPLPPVGALQGLLRNGGRVVEAADPRPLAALLDRSGATRRDPALTALQYRDLGRFLAALAVLPLLMMQRRLT